MQRPPNRSETSNVSPFAQSPRLEATDRYHRAFFLLLDAHTAAEELECDPWEFAVEVQSLNDAGLTNTDFRRLVKTGQICHAREITRIEEDRRVFQRCGGVTFSRRSCFVLSAAGVELARQICCEQSSQVEKMSIIRGLGKPHDGNGFGPRDATPKWDSDRHELNFDGRLVKQFKVPAFNQQAILAAFEEEAWPARIDDPLPPKHGMDPQERLHQTIKNLNKNHKYDVIRFIGDGTGTAVCWKRRTVVGDHTPARSLTLAREVK